MRHTDETISGLLVARPSSFSVACNGAARSKGFKRPCPNAAARLDLGLIAYLNQRS